MKTTNNTKSINPETLLSTRGNDPGPGKDQTERSTLFEELKRSIRAALETYSNVHRGSGHFSAITTRLYEQARDIVLEYLGLKKKNYVVIFSTPRRTEMMIKQLRTGSFICLSSWDLGLALGVRALAVKRWALPKGAPVFTGGGTARLVSPDWVVWSRGPDKFEAGTPAIINIIAFAKALQLVQRFGMDIFMNLKQKELTAADILYHDDLDKLEGEELLDWLKQTLPGSYRTVPTSEGHQPFVNLDYGASTPSFAPVWKAVFQTLTLPEKTKQEIIREVRSITGRTLGAPPEKYEVIFTGNTTEAINLVSESLRNIITPDTESMILNTLLEHNSNELPWRSVQGLTSLRLPVDEKGFIDLNELESILEDYNHKSRHGRKRIRLVAISGASNVLGTMNDLAAISRVVHRYGAQILVDAAQLVAHRKINIEEWNIDYLAFSGHKMYAPFGSGALVARKGYLNLIPEDMESVQISGEENTAGIAALGKAFILLQRIGFDLIRKEEQALTAMALQGLAKIPGIRLYGIRETASSEFDHKGSVVVFSLGMPNVVARKLAQQGGIGVRSGCHCSHLLIKHILHVGPGLENFQGFIVRLFPRLDLPGVVRISFGLGNTKKDIETLLRILNRIAGKSGTPANRNAGSEEHTPSMLSPEPVKQQIEGFIQAVSRKVYGPIQQYTIGNG